MLGTVEHDVCIRRRSGPHEHLCSHAQRGANLELDRALNIEGTILGINNRNLKTLDVSLQTSKDLAANVPADRLLVGESGIGSHADIVDLCNHNIRCFLVGESLMRQDDVTQATRALLGQD